MAAIPAQTLFDETKCYACLGASIPQLLKVGLLRRIVLAEDPTADLSVNALMEYVKCYLCNGTVSGLDAIELALTSMWLGDDTPSPPVEVHQIILDDGVNPPTVINDPAGAYDFSLADWVDVQVINATDVTALAFTNNSALTSLSITGTPLLANITVSLTNLVNLDLSGQTNCDNITIQSNDLLESVDLSGLTFVQANLSIDFHTLLADLNLPALTYVGDTISIQQNASLANILMPVLESFGSALNASNNASLVFVNFTGMTAAGSGGAGNDFDLSGCLSMTDVGLPAIWPFNDNFTVNINGASLSEATVNNIFLSAIAAAPPITASTIDVADGGSATPTGTGLTAAIALDGAGNTITYNP